MKLFRSSKHTTCWFAFGPRIGWVTFPAEAGGWQKRRPARGMKALDVHEVPLRLGFNTGLPGADASAGGPSSLRIRVAA
jgi:hypothetical protein